MPANLKLILDPENVHITDRVPDWKSAVRLAVRPLENEHTVDGGYCRKIIDNTLLYGPYYILIPEAALIHAKYDGVRRTRMAVTLLREKVPFSEKKDKVQLLIALAADSSNSHIEYLRSIVKILKDRGLIQHILKAETAGDLYRMFTE